MKPRNIHVIINPSSGRPNPILHTISSVFKNYDDLKWDITVTHPNRLNDQIQDALDKSIDAVFVYGGDGTVSAVCNQLKGKNIPMGILPGGTANIMAMEMGLLQPMEKTLHAYLKGEAQVLDVDVAVMNDQLFILRLGWGFEAETMLGAPSDIKANIGVLAYMFSGLKALLKTKPIQYQLTIDDEEHDLEGLSLIVANSANLGFPNVSILPGIKVTDGKLDVLLVRAMDIERLKELTRNKKMAKKDYGLFQHWTAQKIHVRTSKKQHIQCDGEIIREKDVYISLLKEKMKLFSLNRKES